MTLETFWKSGWAILFLCGPYLLSAIYFTHCLWISRRLPALLKIMENSSYIITLNRVFGSTSLSGRILLIIQISALIIRPNDGIRAGLICSNDIKKIPPKILRSLKINLGLFLTTIIWMSVLFIII